ncbi:DUF3703 domain-containing protein [Proteobacteria bacterium 005FR1]|nr:DUF3703 domain-containing protein [Proteobacteria bacterium 005FR1]
MDSFTKRIRPHVNAEAELARQAQQRGDFSVAFHHLERAHVLGQLSTREHVRVHWLMLLWGAKRGNIREVLGQVLRIIGAATKTAFGLVPSGNTGGANISPFKPLPVPADLAEIIASARQAP